MNQAVTRGAVRQKVRQPGSVMFIQRFGSALNVNVHFHVIVLEGVYLDCTDEGRKPRFVKGEPSTDADIAAVVQTISRRVIRKLHHLGYLEAGCDAVATGYDPLLDDEPALAHTLAASVKQRMAFGEWAGQQVRRIGSGFGYEGERPALTGPRCASVHGFSPHANTQVPAHRRDRWNALFGTRREAPWRWNVWRKLPMGTSCTRSQNRGLTGRPALPSRLWNSWRSWRRWYRCRASISCGMEAVWRRTAACAARSRRHRANRVWMGMRPTRGHPLELGKTAGARVRPGYGHLSLLLRGALRIHRRLPRNRLSRVSCVISSWPPFHLPLPLPVLVKQRSTGSPKPTMSRVVS